MCLGFCRVLKKDARRHFQVIMISLGHGHDQNGCLIENRWVQAPIPDSNASARAYLTKHTGSRTISKATSPMRAKLKMRQLWQRRQCGQCGECWQTW
jgi:hypothetical protein